MAKKKYDRGMNNFKIEQLEPRQMFSADVGLNDIEQQLNKQPRDGAVCGRRFRRTSQVCKQGLDNKPTEKF